MLAIFKRELRSCFHGMIGAVLTAFMLAATAIYFVALNLGYGLPDFGYYTLYRTIFVLLLYIPVLTMRSFAEERHSRTDQLLLTSPVSVGGIVLGKYFALCVIFALPCLVDAGMILVLKALGATGTSTLANFSALLCYYLMGCAAIAIGVFLSSLTENQIIAAVSGVAALLLAYMMPSLRTMFTTGSAVALALFTAIAAASADFAQGDVGAGKGMTCHDLKGGIGSSSRLVEIGGETFTVGVLVLTNHGCLHDLTIGGENIGKAIEQRIREDTPDEGSCIMIVGTDLPVTSRQLGRIIRRCSVGLARLGSYIGHGSGEVMVGFSTANRIPAQGDCLNFRCIHESHIDDAFRAVAEATEEAVLRSMLEAHPVTGYTGKVRRSLGEFWQP